MLTPIPSNDEILSEIAAHCDKEGITMTEFSARCGNVAIVTRLKKGRSLSTAVFNRVAEVLRSAE